MPPPERLAPPPASARGRCSASHGAPSGDDDPGRDGRRPWTRREDDAPAGPATDPRAAYDAMARRYPVARTGAGEWMLFRHADVVAAAADPEAFSSRAHRHLHAPNGMDGSEHAAFREIVDRHLDPASVPGLERCLRLLAAELAGSLPRDQPFDAMRELGARYAVRAQSAWLGWPAELEEELLAWMDDKRAASSSRDPDRVAAVAERFDAIIRSLLDARREAGGAPGDVTARLLSETVDGRPLSDEEVVSILRNWTAGDLGSIASCVGVIVHRLAADPALQERLRSTSPGAEGLALEIDEMLRIDDPYVSSRRVARADVEVGGRSIHAGQRVLLNWTAANRDPEAFGDPDAYRPQENAARNLVYGTGPHACPGRALATLELRVLAEELLAATGSIDLVRGAPPVRERPPGGGYRALPVRLRPLQTAAPPEAVSPD